MNYTINQVSPPRVFQNQHGELVSYWLSLAEFPQDRVEIVQKPTTPAPTPTQVVAGDIVQRPNGMYQLKKDYQGTQQAGLQQRAEVMTQRHDPQPVLPPQPDERDKRITRQHSQHMALLFLDLVATGSDREAIRFEAVQSLTDLFDKDVLGEPAVMVPRNPAVHVAGTVAPPNGTNGAEVRKVSTAQVEKFLRPRMAALDPTSLRSLLDRFGINRIEELPMSRVDEFAEATSQPVRTGESDVPSPEPLPVRQVETDPSFPF